jgi:hypothetical protein
VLHRGHGHSSSEQASVIPMLMPVGRLSRRLAERRHFRARVLLNFGPLQSKEALDIVASLWGRSGCRRRAAVARTRQLVVNRFDFASTHAFDEGERRRRPMGSCRDFHHSKHRDSNRPRDGCVSLQVVILALLLFSPAEIVGWKPINNSAKRSSWRKSARSAAQRFDPERSSASLRPKECQHTGLRCSRSSMMMAPDIRGLLGFRF